MTSTNDAMWAGTVTITGREGDEIEAYLARPLGAAPRGGVVVIHHMPGYDAATKEIVRRFAAQRVRGDLPEPLLAARPPARARTTPPRPCARRAASPDEQLVGDVAGAARHLRALTGANGKVGVIGYCSGGRQAFLAACSLQLDAAVDCYGAFVVNEPPAGVPARR